MRTTIIVLALLLTCAPAHANEIDKLKTIREIGPLLANKTYRYGAIIPIDTIGITGFFKMDIDGNGLTDLVINRTHCFAILDMGDGHYEVNIMFTDRVYTALDVLCTPDGSLLVVQSHRYDDIATSNKENDTLICKFGGFIEYNRNPGKLKIEEIVMSYSNMLGGYFDAKINADRLIRYKGNAASAAKIDTTSFIDTASFDQLIQTINYLDLFHLKDIYAEEGTDLPTLLLDIRFSNGQIKNLQIYGDSGTFGLQNISAQLFAIIGAQHWNR